MKRVRLSKENKGDYGSIHIVTNAGWILFSAQHTDIVCVIQCTEAMLP